ncbi:MAG: hypothetical protein NTX25_10540 [Proteobacteria bacterium]|nr:hypothetical protein [Pseudomonadota bacterium]
MEGKIVKIINKNSLHYGRAGLRTKVAAGCMGDLHTVKFKDGGEEVFVDGEIYVLKPSKLFPISIWRLAFSRKDLRYAIAEDQSWAPLFPRYLDRFLASFDVYLLWRAS